MDFKTFFQKNLEFSTKFQKFCETAKILRELKQKFHLKLQNFGQKYIVYGARSAAKYMD